MRAVPIDRTDEDQGCCEGCVAEGFARLMQACCRGVAKAGRIELLACLLILSSSGAVVSGLGEASKRLAPVPVDPIRVGEFEYRVPNDPDKIGVVERWSTKSNKWVNDIRVFRSWKKPWGERDAHWIFITNINWSADQLVVKDELGRVFYVKPSETRGRAWLSVLLSIVGVVAAAVIGQQILRQSSQRRRDDRHGR